MQHEGPYIQQLTHRLSECPGDFLSSPKIGRKAGTNVDAIVFDTMLDLGGKFPNKLDLIVAAGSQLSSNHLKLVMVTSWLLHDPFFIDAGRFAEPAMEFLKGGLTDLAKIVAADLFVTDPDRREELARSLLAALQLRPRDETQKQAEDRLVTLSSVKRSKLISDMRKKMKREKKLREEMRKKRAREAAARTMRE